MLRQDEAAVVQQGNFPTPREKAPYASNSFALTKLPGISKRKEGAVGAGPSDSAWWEHTQCVGGRIVRGLAAPMKDQ